MRIGIFTETYTPYISGLVTSEIMLKKALENQGHEVYVVTANLESFKYDYDEKERVLKIPGIPTGIYDSRLSSIYPVRAVNKIKSWKLWSSRIWNKICKRNACRYKTSNI